MTAEKGSEFLFFGMNQFRTMFHSIKTNTVRDLYENRYFIRHYTVNIQCLLLQNPNLFRLLLEFSKRFLREVHRAMFVFLSLTIRTRTSGQIFE